MQKVISAGTLESSDVLIKIAPYEGLCLQIESKVMQIFGRQIRQTVEEVLQERNIQNAKVIVLDQAALDCTIRARLNVALDRYTNELDVWSMLEDEK